MPKKVLVVDDDDNTRRFLTVALEENGYEATTAADGEEGYQKIVEDRPEEALAADIEVVAVNEPVYLRGCEWHRLRLPIFPAASLR